LNDTAEALILSLGAIVLAAAGVAVWARRSGTELQPLFFIVLGALLAVVLVSTAADDTVQFGDNLLIGVSLIVGLAAAWYTAQSWRKTGWSQTTQGLAFGVFVALVFVLMRLFLR
jgi:hypothetical protein